MVAYGCPLLGSLGDGEHGGLWEPAPGDPGDRQCGNPLLGAPCFVSFWLFTPCWELSLLHFPGTQAAVAQES